MSVSTTRYPIPSVVMILYVSSRTVTIGTIRNHVPPFSYGYNNSWSMDFAKLYENHAPPVLMMLKQQFEHFVL